MEQRTSKGGMTVSKMRPTDKTKCPPGGSLPRHTEKSTEKSIEKSTSQVLPTSQKPTGRQSTETRTEKSTEKSTQKSTGKSTKSTKIPLKPPIKSATMKSTGFSPKRTSKDDYLVKQHLRVNATPGCERYSTKHCTKAQQSAGTVELGKYNHLREAYVLDIHE